MAATTRQATLLATAVKAVFRVSGGTAQIGGSSLLNLTGGTGGGNFTNIFATAGAGGMGGFLDIASGAGTATISDSAVVDLSSGQGGLGNSSLNLSPGNGGQGGKVLLFGGGGTLYMTGGKILLLGGQGGFDSSFSNPQNGSPGLAGSIEVSGGTFNLTAGQITADTSINPATPITPVKAAINVSGGTLNINDHMTIDSGTLSRNGSHFNLAANKILTVQNNAVLSLIGSYEINNNTFNINSASNWPQTDDLTVASTDQGTLYT